METRKIGELGINAHNNNSFNEVARRELGINSKDPRFEWNTEQTQPHILLGLKSGSLLSLPMKEEEMLKSELKVPVFSPELQIWRTPLNQKLLITGSCGMNPELVEVENNYPRFNLITKENETDDDILARVKIKGDEIINSLLKIKSNRNKRGRNKNNHGKVYSTKNIRKIKRSKGKTKFPSDSEAEESHSGTEKEEMEDNPPPLTERGRF